MGRRLPGTAFLKPASLNFQKKEEFTSRAKEAGRWRRNSGFAQRLVNVIPGFQGVDLVFVFQDDAGKVGGGFADEFEDRIVRDAAASQGAKTEPGNIRAGSVDEVQQQGNVAVAEEVQDLVAPLQRLLQAKFQVAVENPRNVENRVHGVAEIGGQGKEGQVFLQVFLRRDFAGREKIIFDINFAGVFAEDLHQPDQFVDIGPLVEVNDIIRRFQGAKKAVERRAVLTFQKILVQKSFGVKVHFLKTGSLAADRRQRFRLLQ